MDTRLFTRIVAVVEHGSMNKAAQALNLSQPALSKSIQALEIDFGVPLLHRGASGVTATEYGKLVIDRFQLINSELQGIRAELDALRDDMLGKVTIGIPPGHGFISRVMVRATRRLFDDHRRVGLSLIIGSREQLLPALRRGELDILVADLASAVPEDLIVEPLYTDRFMIVVRAGHPLAGQPTIRTADLMDYQWIISTETDGFGDQLSTSAIDFSPPKHSETIISNSSLFIKLLLTDTDAVSLIAHDAIAAEIENRTFTELKLEDGSEQAINVLTPRKFGFLYRDEANISAACRALMKNIRQCCRRGNEH
jgi:DNA-binding transcriptional LysR family regulator